MSDIKQYPVLEFISEQIKNAIADAALTKESETVSIIRDGNDIIHIAQLSAQSDNNASILITDKKEILYSEDLLVELQKIHLAAEPGSKLYEALKTASIVVNGLSIETGFILQAVKDCFDTLSSSYEFIKIVEKNINSLTIEFTFGANKFKIIVANEPDNISVSTEFGNGTDAKINEIIKADVLKVQNAVNKLFKKDQAV